LELDYDVTPTKDTTPWVEVREIEDTDRGNAGSYAGRPSKDEETDRSDHRK
jgi:hypothetical protein